MQTDTHTLCGLCLEVNKHLLHTLYYIHTSATNLWKGSWRNW